MSYLIFGRPSYELGDRRTAKSRRGAASSVLGVAARRWGHLPVRDAGHAPGHGALSREVGLDYLSITQAGDFGVARDHWRARAERTRRWRSVGTRARTSSSSWSSDRARSRSRASSRAPGLEVALNDNYNVQGFWEDRFLRSGITGSATSAGQANRVIGVFIFRDWGY